MTKSSKNSNTGFTIVELIIVVAVIAVLATVTLVAYTGTQARARDTERLSEMEKIEEAIELYFVYNGGYPNCSGGTYVAGTAEGTCTTAGLAAALVPTYLTAVPTDPKNSGNDVYQYAFGYKKTGSNSFIGGQTSNYITGMRLETVSGNVNGGWVAPAYYNYLGGSK